MYYLGIDLGGTNIAVGIVDEKGKILNTKSVPTKAQREDKEIIKDMADTCLSLLKEENLSLDDIEAVGVGSPGSIDSKNGVVVYANNLNMENSKVGPMLSELLGGKKVYLDNDAKVAAYGEYYINGDNSESFVFITLGTGVGGGVIINGNIYRGFNGAGGELGHIIINMDGEQCTCGNKGCWEAYASVTALVAQTKRAMENNPDSMMIKFAEEKGVVNGRTAFECAKKGDKAAEEVVKAYQNYIAAGMINILNIFQPQKILVGGGISKEGEYLLGPVRDIVYKGDYNKYMQKAVIETATLFNDAGIIGAAMLGNLHK